MEKLPAFFYYGNPDEEKFRQSLKTDSTIKAIGQMLLAEGKGYQEFMIALVCLMPVGLNEKQKGQAVNAVINVLKNRLHYFERLALRQLEFEARKREKEDFHSFDLIKQIEWVKGFISDVEGIMENGLELWQCETTEDGKIKKLKWKKFEAPQVLKTGSPPAFNAEEVEALLKEAFENVGVYSDGVLLKTEKHLKAWLKAAFRVLVQRGVISPDSQKDFEKFSKATFNPGISSRALYEECNQSHFFDLSAIISKK